MCVRGFVGHQSAITAIALSPNGQYLASASTLSLFNGAESSVINLWDLGSGRLVKSFSSPASLALGRIDTLCFSRESKVLVSGGTDRKVRIWDVDAPVIVEAYYKRLVEIRSANEMESGYTGAASALHDAARVLREKIGEDKFARWAPFVHFGV